MKGQEDPFLWLEEVLGAEPLAWVEALNVESRAALTGGEEFRSLEARLLAILDSDARIPGVVRGDRGRYYNFWCDKQHERGLWRRTSFEQYATETPEWETVLDLDALARDEQENWVWGDAQLLPPDYTRALISLSRGGGDATVLREFDLSTDRFVADGFRLPEGKHNASWKDLDTLYVGTDFGPGSMTSSGYPRIVKEWSRGTPLAEALTIFEGEADDVAVSAHRDHTPGYVRDFVYRRPTFFSSKVFLRRGDQLTPIDKPDSAVFAAWRDWMLLRLRHDWHCGQRELAAGSLLAAPLSDWLEGKREVELLFEPGERTSLAGFGRLQNHLLLNELDNVRNRIYVLTPPAGQAQVGRLWAREPLPGVPALGTVEARGESPYESDVYFMSVTDFLTPTSLYHGTVGKREPRMLKRSPVAFETAGLSASQHEALSADGTRVPYFQVAREELEADGSHPTMLTGYGGFEIPMLPAYEGERGAAWLARGGVLIVANIRGGGEFGPEWHRAALKENRPRAYEDFIAVAEHAIERGITSPAHLGAVGGSNGGLLVGNMLTRRPDLFGAIVCRVPLLDMRRYHELPAGASWMAEYGDPDDPEQWEFIQKFSPYHCVRAGVEYPPVLFTTSTRDDRVHPGHARKMAARMREQGHDVLYYENVEGGHGGAANNAQTAFMSALAFTFLWQKLGGSGRPTFQE